MLPFPCCEAKSERDAVRVDSKTVCRECAKNAALIRPNECRDVGCVLRIYRGIQVTPTALLLRSVLLYKLSHTLMLKESTTPIFFPLGQRQGESKGTGGRFGRESCARDSEAVSLLSSPPGSESPKSRSHDGLSWQWLGKRSWLADATHTVQCTISHWGVPPGVCVKRILS